MTTSEDELKALMLDGLDGHAAAQASLLRALAPRLRSFYRHRMKDADDVEDLVQETLIAVHTRRATYDRERPVLAWLYAIAKHKMIDHFRRQRPFVPVEAVESILISEGFEEAAIARLDVDRLLGGLPSKQARMIRSTRVDGLSVAEAAASAGIGESDVKVSVHRGLKALAARILGS